MSNRRRGKRSGLRRKQLRGEHLETRRLLAAPEPISGYELSWFDDFDQPSLDVAKWTAVDTNVPTNNSLQDYLPNQVSVANGNLVIRSDSTPSRGLPYSSGQVISTALHKYGRFEVRAKLPTSTGMWPAIWLLPDTPNWPSQGEIDIMENRGNQPTLTSSAFHYGTNPPYQHNFVFSEQETINNGTRENYHDSFHEYAVEWDPTQLRFFVDDVHYYTVFDQDTGGFLSSNVGDMRLIMNTAIGGGFLDNPDGSTVWPQTFEIDHVHVYELADTPRVLSFENDSFENNGGSLAHWTTFGNSIGNISSGQQHINGGTESLKLYGQFNNQPNYSGISQGITVQPGDSLVATAEAFASSLDSIQGSGNQLFLNIDYFSKQHGLFGSADYIGSDSIPMANGSSPQDTWLPSTLNSTVPIGAVEARVAVVFAQQDNAGGAVFVDNASFAIELDYGDAPMGYPTRLAENGARHRPTGPRLGSTRDTELDGQPSTADGSDEDGVMFGGIGLNEPVAAMNVLLGNAASAKVDAWIDFNRDGDWDDAGENILHDVLVNNATQTLNYDLPPNLTEGEHQARVRISSAGGLSPTGLADDGEVEDYAVTILRPARVESVVINEGNAQRSGIETVRVTFDSVVDIDWNTGDVFEFVNNDTGAVVVDAGVEDHSTGKTIVDVTFTHGPSVNAGGGLLDGDYRLIISADLVTRQTLSLDGNRNGTAGGDYTFGATGADEFYRKYGEYHTNGVVDLLDFASFRQAFGSTEGLADYVRGLDADADGVIGLLDFANFRMNFGS